MTNPNVSVLLGNTNTSAVTYASARRSPVLYPRIFTSGCSRCSFSRIGPSPTTTCVTVCRRAKNASMFFASDTRPVEPAQERVGPAERDPGEPLQVLRESGVIGGGEMPAVVPAKG